MYWEISRFRMNRTSVNPSAFLKRSSSTVGLNPNYLRPLWVRQRLGNIRLLGLYDSGFNRAAKPLQYTQMSKPCMTCCVRVRISSENINYFFTSLRWHNNYRAVVAAHWKHQNNQMNSPPLYILCNTTGNNWCRPMRQHPGIHAYITIKVFRWHLKWVCA